MSVKSPIEPQLAAKRSVYLVLLSRWLTNKLMILHSSSSKIAKRVWMLARTLANPSAFPTILHSKGRITYLPSFSEILGDQTILLTCTSPLIAIALQKGTQAYGVDKILLCLNTVRRIDYHLSQESSPTSPPWLATLGREGDKPNNRSKTQKQPTQPASTSTATPPASEECGFFFLPGGSGGREGSQCGAAVRLV